MGILINLGLFLLISLQAFLALVVALPVILSIYGLEWLWCCVRGGEPVKLQA
jgi:hypothetical protein